MRLRQVIERLRAGIERIWTNHRAPAIAISVIAVVAVVAAGLLVVVMPGGTAQATATPSAAPSAAASPSSPYASDSSSPLPSPSDTPAASETPGTGALFQPARRVDPPAVEWSQRSQHHAWCALRSLI